MPRIDLYPTVGGVKTVTDGRYRVISETKEPKILTKMLADSFIEDGYSVKIHEEPEPEGAQNVSA